MNIQHSERSLTEVDLNLLMLIEVIFWLENVSQEAPGLQR